MKSNIVERSEQFISSNKLLIDTIKGYLIPLNKQNDTTYWFKINKISG
jgi:hypothetical protein